MAKKSRSKRGSDSTEGQAPEVPMVDFDLSLGNLTELFWADYQYHTNALTSYFATYTPGMGNKELQQSLVPVTHFGGLKRIEAASLGLRPFPGQKGVDIDKPNQNHGYMKKMMKYLMLPYKSVFSEHDFARVSINRDLFDVEKKTVAEREEEVMEAGGLANKHLNTEVSVDVSDAFTQLLLCSKKFSKAHEEMPKHIVLAGYAPFIHSPVDWEVDTLHPLDLITEPQAKYDPDTWTRFFVIQKMTASEAIEIIQDKSRHSHWNPNALRWALENSYENRGLLDGGKRTTLLDYDDLEMQGENFAIRSYYQDRNLRLTSLNSYYGSFYVVQAYYRNKEGTIDKVIFYPSSLFLDESIEQQVMRASKNPPERREDLEDWENTRGAGVLYRFPGAYERMSEAVTVIPFEREEPVLERQRSYGHELYALCDNTTRLDSSILTAGYLMGEIFYKNANEGTDANDLQDKEMGQFGGGIDVSSITIEENPFQLNLQGLIAVRSLFVNEIQAKCFLGGLDNTETMGEGRGAQLANLRLIKDGRIHKHAVEDFAKGLKELYSKTLCKILKMCKNKIDVEDDIRLKYFFLAQLTKVDGYDPGYIDYEKKDIVPDTYLPYWMTLEAIRNGASQFGAAETVLYNEVKNLFGEGLDQRASQNLARMGIQSILGPQQMKDILGNKADQKITDQDQLYRAKIETATIIGSISSSSAKFVAIPILPDQDDHVLHLSQEHNPKAMEYIEALQNVDFAPNALAEMSEGELESRNDMILALAALSMHISLHQAALEKFGKKRKDVNQLKEETNNILQTSEALLRNLQVTQRALVAKRQEDAARLANLSPENVAEQEKQRTKQMEIQRAIVLGQNQLSIANKMAAIKEKQHIDGQLTKARDREAKLSIEREKIAAKKVEMELQSKQNKKGDGAGKSA